MFYLLKSTHDRELVGDVVINKNEIESIALSKKITKKETYFKLLITMKSEDGWIALFNTEDEAKAEMKNLGIPEDIISEYQVQICDEEKEKKERMHLILEGADL